MTRSTQVQPSQVLLKYGNRNGYGIGLFQVAEEVVLKFFSVAQFGNADGRHHFHRWELFPNAHISTHLLLPADWLLLGATSFGIAISTYTLWTIYFPYGWEIPHATRQQKIFLKQILFGFMLIIELVALLVATYKTVATLSYSAKLTQKANQRMKVFQEDEDLQPNIWFSLPPLIWMEDPLEIYRTRSKTDLKEWSQMAWDIMLFGSFGIHLQRSTRTIWICRTRLKPNTIQSLMVLKAQLRSERDRKAKKQKADLAAIAKGNSS
ncbi:hypothetical protein BT69DRAFT_1361190 [Atractiella rhizophila]|nr:hypothetical protein BT69DRAFT_1361190 [Atractiella rhizophila]